MLRFIPLLALSLGACASAGPQLTAAMDIAAINIASVLRHMAKRLRSSDNADAVTDDVAAELEGLAEALDGKQ